MAGYTSHARNTLLEDYVLLAEKLKQLGFATADGKVIIIDGELGSNRL